MYREFYIYLKNPSYFRYGFFIAWVLASTLNTVISENSNTYILYVLSVIFLGIGFYNKSVWFLVTFTTLVVVCRFFLISERVATPFTFLIHLLTYLLIMFISAGFMKHYQKLKESGIELITALVNALDSRDPYTLHHSENVAKVALEIAQKMRLSKIQCDIIHTGGLLHDIGKIGLPEHILKKPGKLTDEEYTIIKNHPVIGYEMMKHISYFNKCGLLDIVLYHHERYDGKGYPEGLKGNKIPLFARIVAIADTFDAMMSKRVYREEISLEYTLDEIRKNKGTQFDPEITDVFLSLFQKEK